MEKSTSFLDFFGITHNFRIQKDNNCQNKLIRKVIRYIFPMKTSDLISFLSYMLTEAMGNY